MVNSTRKTRHESASACSACGDGKLAFIFPGQGSQYPGMGERLAEHHRKARDLFRAADAALGFGLADLCFRGTREDLALTRNTQPAVLATSIAAYVVLKSMGALPGIVAGHSLGEYSALVAAESLPFEDALRLVRIRGQLMEQAVPTGVGAMAAVVGLARAEVARSCESASEVGWVEPANYNGPDQVVISGESAGVSRAAELCLAAGARRVVPLDVSGPFHSRMMAPVRKAFEQELSQVRIRPPSIPVVMNVHGRIARTSDEVRDALARQVCSPVMWEECIATMWEAGARVFVEVGPGKVLSGLARRIVPKAHVVSAETGAPIERVVEVVKGVLRDET